MGEETHRLESAWVSIKFRDGPGTCPRVCSYTQTGFGAWSYPTAGLPGWLSGKESAANAGAAGDAGLIPESGGSPGGHGNPFQCSCLGPSHGQRSLAGYSPWGHKESDMAEHAHRFRPHSSPAEPPGTDCCPVSSSSTGCGVPSA